MDRELVSELRAKVPTEVFDYTVLMGLLSHYANPRKRITALLKSGDIIRVKKGLYIFGDRHRRRLVSREALANLLYGPSYVSCESALAFHGLIPERVEAVISMTLKRSKVFETPLGRFEYRALHESRYAPGVERQTVEEQPCLIATTEKAVADLVAPHRDLQSRKAIREYLYESLRLDEGWIGNRARLQRIAKAYGNPRVNLLLRVT